MECDCIKRAAVLLLLKVNSKGQGSAMLMLMFKDVANFAAQVISHRSVSLPDLGFQQFWETLAMWESQNATVKETLCCNQGQLL